VAADRQAQAMPVHGEPRGRLAIVGWTFGRCSSQDTTRSVQGFEGDLDRDQPQRTRRMVSVIGTRLPVLPLGWLAGSHDLRLNLALRSRATQSSPCRHSWMRTGNGISRSWRRRDGLP
jgi:hypothetical protein